jgi:hypothetical protein
MLYFDLYKKDKILTKILVFYTYTHDTNLLFLYSSKYNVISNKTLHVYSGKVYVFME